MEGSGARNAIMAFLMFRFIFFSMLEDVVDDDQERRVLFI